MENESYVAPAWAISSDCWSHFLRRQNEVDTAARNSLLWHAYHVRSAALLSDGDPPDSSYLAQSGSIRHLHPKGRAEIMTSIPRRWASGEDSWLARTTAKTVLQLRKLYSTGNLTQAMLAERFGLSLSNVKSILGRRSWKHT
jgi:hypothetical protein